MCVCVCLCFSVFYFFSEGVVVLTFSDGYFYFMVPLQKTIIQGKISLLFLTFFSWHFYFFWLKVTPEGVSFRLKSPINCPLIISFPVKIASLDIDFQMREYAEYLLSTEPRSIATAAQIICIILCFLTW